MHFPNPEFVHDKECAQHLFFKKFIAQLNKNYIALSLTAHDEMLNFVSDCCEAFYKIDKANDIRRDIINSSKEQKKELAA